jgi:aryl-alcohol dehydrogenase-like predicted oxidoreductase
MTEGLAFLERNNYPLPVCSNQMSLALWNTPIAHGCVSVRTPADKEWFERHQVPLFAWAPLAQGFALDQHLVPTSAQRAVWFCGENLARLVRAHQLAVTLGVSVAQVALAYVLSHPFPTFAVVGTRSLEHLREAMTAVEVDLTAKDCAWLDSGRNS